MPFQIKQILNELREPVTIIDSEMVHQALDRMIEHDFSQLPVLDDHGELVGLITSDSILRSLIAFGATLDVLRVRDAMENAYAFSEENNLSELLERLRTAPAVIVVNKQNETIGIVTSYDTNEYFRRYAEDIMLVEDIEGSIKGHINAAFTTDHGNLDETARNEVLVEITTQQYRKSRESFEKALKHFLRLLGQQDFYIQNEEHVKTVFQQHFKRPPAKNFEDLTLYEFIEVLLHDSRWPTYGRLFGINAQVMRNMLREVVGIRNIIMHFRGDLTAKQQSQLRFCAAWLERYQPVLPKATPVVIELTELSISEDQPSSHPIDAQQPHRDDDDHSIEESPVTRESRYAPLSRWLLTLPRDTERVEIRFHDIEKLIDDGLPLSARRHRAWWANEPVSHPQAESWLSADWRVAGINMNEERVVFARTRDRETAYIKFFSTLNQQLKEKAPVFNPNSPNGQSWITVGKMTLDHRPIASFVFSFTRDARFRVELYIDTGIREVNKTLLNGLQQSFNDRLEPWGEFLEQKISWEALPEKRGSRIAIYHPGSVSNSAPELETLRQWAVPLMIKFYTTINQLRSIMQDSLSP